MLVHAVPLLCGQQRALLTQTQIKSSLFSSWNVWTLSALQQRHTVKPKLNQLLVPPRLIHIIHNLLSNRQQADRANSTPTALERHRAVYSDHSCTH